LKQACKLTDNFKAERIVENVIHQRDVEPVRMVEFFSDGAILKAFFSVQQKKCFATALFSY